MVEGMDRLFDEYLFAGLGPERWLEEFIRAAGPGMILPGEDEIALASFGETALPEMPDLNALLAPLTGGQPPQGNPSGGRPSHRRAARPTITEPGSLSPEVSEPHDTGSDHSHRESAAGGSEIDSARAVSEIPAWRSFPTNTPGHFQSSRTAGPPRQGKLTRQAQRQQDSPAHPGAAGEAVQPGPRRSAPRYTGGLVEGWAAAAAAELVRAWRQRYGDAGKLGALPVEEMRAALKDHFASPIQAQESATPGKEPSTAAFPTSIPQGLAFQPMPESRSSMPDVQAGREPPLARIPGADMPEGTGNPVLPRVSQDPRAATEGPTQAEPGTLPGAAFAPSTPSTQSTAPAKAPFSSAVDGEVLRRQIEEWFQRRAGSLDPTAAEPSLLGAPATHNTFNITVQMADAIPDEGELADRITRIMIDQARRYGIEVG